MKIVRKRHIKLKSFIAKCWYLADEINKTAELVRMAHKPSDLLFPRRELLTLIRRIMLLEDSWLRRWLTDNPHISRTWPKLHERHH